MLVCESRSWFYSCARLGGNISSLCPAAQHLLRAEHSPASAQFSTLHLRFSAQHLLNTQLYIQLPAPSICLAQLYISSAKNLPSTAVFSSAQQLYCALHLLFIVQLVLPRPRKELSQCKRLLTDLVQEIFIHRVPFS